MNLAPGHLLTGFFFLEFLIPQLKFSKLLTMDFSQLKNPVITSVIINDPPWCLYYYVSCIEL